MKCQIYDVHNLHLMKGTALLTGASSGIGSSMARILAEEGWNLVIVGRSKDRLERMRDVLSSKNGVKVTVVEADLSLDGAAQGVYETVKGYGIEVDYLINCAGIGDFGFFVESDLKKQEDMIHINDLALVSMTGLFVPDMIARGSGRILNVSSVAAFQPGPLMSIYYASKAFVQSFTEALAVELKGTGVKVSVLCPGPTDTPFLEKAGQTEQNMYKKSACVTADKVAAYGLRKAEKGKVVIVCGLDFKLMIFFVRLAPRSLTRWAVFKLQGKPSPEARKKAKQGGV